MFRPIVLPIFACAAVLAGFGASVRAEPGESAWQEADEAHAKSAQAMTKAALEAQRRALGEPEEADAPAKAAAKGNDDGPASQTAAKPAADKPSSAEAPGKDGDAAPAKTDQTAAKTTTPAAREPTEAHKEAVSDEIAERHRKAATTDDAGSKPTDADATDRAVTDAADETDASKETASLDTTEPAPPPPAHPVVKAVRDWLAGAEGKVTSAQDDIDAVVAFYGARTEGPLWVDDTGFSAKGKAAVAEMNKAADWGLSASAFALPRFNVDAPSDAALAEAEARVSLEVLKYARHARGGRIVPSSVSNLLDMSPPLKDPNAVIAELAKSAQPDSYLRGLHPQHDGFKALHKALLKARGPAKDDVEEIDPALTVRLPRRSAVLRLGSNDPEVAELRKRLSVPAVGGAAGTEFDEELELALKAYQLEQGIAADGILGNGTRGVLNREVDAVHGPDPSRMVQLIELNMERWRWLPEKLGRVHVLNNIPEYTTRTFKDGEVIFQEKIIVGLPEWPTPVFSETMKTVVFNPSWGMPNGIKTRELAPRLRRASGGGDFFSQLFGGGGSSAGAAIRAYGLKVYAGGREINPDSVNWNAVDIRNYSFIQPPGPKNPLGQVKFMFPNRHDVYMHDTIERSLFAKSSRALSHGCIRVQDPMQFARVMLSEGNGLDARSVERTIAGGGDVRLKNPIPVHNVYMTAAADENGKVKTFPDLYGLDTRVSSALLGRPLPRDPAAIETASANDPSTQRQAPRTKAKSKQPSMTLEDVLTGFWLN